MKSHISIKRIYELPSSADGSRILIDRIWPRGLQKSKINIDEWVKEVAPSTSLRKWFNHEQAKWTAFIWRYKEELKSNVAAADLTKRLYTKKKVTLLYGAKDKEHNHAIVLKDFLENE